MEDASYPYIGAWFVEGFRPPATRFESLRLAFKHFRKAWRRGITSMGLVFSDLLSEDLSNHTCVLLCMGLDKANGVLSLGKDGYVDVDWPYRDSMALYNAILDAGKRFNRTVEGRRFFPLPTWANWLFQRWRRNITVHPLGGCILANSPSEGVTSGEDDNFGQVFGYPGLYIADGSVVPTAVGANPTAVISALAEKISKGITCIPPDAKL
jgi:cholesterol oxidase